MTEQPKKRPWYRLHRCTVIFIVVAGVAWGVLSAPILYMICRSLIKPYPEDDWKLWIMLIQFVIPLAILIVAIAAGIESVIRWLGRRRKLAKAGKP